MDLHIHAIRIANQHEPFVFVNARHLSKEYGCIPLLPHNSAEGRPNLTRCENRSRHLVKEWLKQVMIRTIDENDSRRRALQGLDGCQSTEAAADNHDNREMVSHIL
jgi:hypothetical protein